MGSDQSESEDEGGNGEGGFTSPLVVTAALQTPRALMQYSRGMPVMREGELVKPWT